MVIQSTMFELAETVNVAKSFVVSKAPPSASLKRKRIVPSFEMAGGVNRGENHEQSQQDTHPYLLARLR